MEGGPKEHGRPFGVVGGSWCAWDGDRRREQGDLVEDLVQFRVPVLALRGSAWADAHGVGEVVKEGDGEAARVWAVSVLPRCSVAVL